MPADHQLDERLRVALRLDDGELDDADLHHVAVAVRERVARRRRRRRASVAAAAAVFVLVTAGGLAAGLGGPEGGEPLAVGSESKSPPARDPVGSDQEVPPGTDPVSEPDDVLAPLGPCRSLAPEGYRPGDIWSDDGADEPDFQSTHTTDTECGRSLEDTLLRVLDPGWTARTDETSAVGGEWTAFTDEMLGAPLGEGTSYAFDWAWATAVERGGGLIRFEVMPVSTDVSLRIAERGWNLADIDGHIYPLPDEDLPPGWSAVSTVIDRGQGAGGRVTVGRDGRVGILYRITYHRLPSAPGASSDPAPTAEQINALALELAGAAPVGPVP